MFLPVSVCRFQRERVMFLQCLALLTTFFLALGRVLLTGPALADEKAGKVQTSPESEDAEQRDELTRVKELIELLASRNVLGADRRVSQLDHDMTIPPAYNVRDQAVVYLAIQQLLQEGDSAFDMLAQHFDDKRYSVTIESPSCLEHWSVGVVCRRIMQRQFYCFEDVGFLEEITSNQYRRPSEDVATSWKRIHGTPLWKIQAETIQTQIGFFRNLDLIKVRPAHPFQKRPPIKALEEMRARNIAKLETMRAAIVGMREAYRPKSIEEPLGRVIWLPWRFLFFNG